MDTIKQRIWKRIQRRSARGRQWVFSAKDLLDLASRAYADLTLANLVRGGKIRRIGRGLYDMPKADPLLGPLAPSLNEAAEAIARKFGWSIFPHGATAANMLGLSQQVPGRMVFLSTGPTRTISVGKNRISFKHAAPKDLRAKHYSSVILIHGLLYMGQGEVDERTLDHLRKSLSPTEKKHFVQDSQYGSGWICDVAKAIQEDGK